jgi:hypothetical protein
VEGSKVLFISVSVLVFVFTGKATSVGPVYS